MRRIFPTERSIEATSTTSTVTLTPIDALILRASSASAAATSSGDQVAGELAIDW